MQGGRYDRRRRNERITSQPRRQVQARGGGRDQRYRSARNYRTIRGTDTGYNLRKRNINFTGKAGGSVGRAVSANPRPWLLGVAAITLLALVIFGLTRCVSSCTADNERKGQEVNEQDERVAVGVASELTSKLTVALDQGERLASIAARANELDPQLVELALDEPAAINFVAAYDPNGEHVASHYDSSVTKGSYVHLFCWDARWGAVEFAGGPLALTGSGPTSLFIAYLGLTGKTDLGPADIAGKAEAAGKTEETLGLSGSFLTDSLGDLGLAASTYDVSGERIGEVLDAGTVIMLRTKQDGALGSSPHWVLAATENADGTVNVYDPMSTTVSARPWATSTLASATDAMYAITAIQQQDDGWTDE